MKSIFDKDEDGNLKLLAYFMPAKISDGTNLELAIFTRHRQKLILLRKSVRTHILGFLK